MKLLALSGGSLVGQNLLEALAPRRDGIELIATNSHADEPCLYDYDRVYLVPATREEGFAARIEALIAAEAPDLVLPCRDDDVVWLAGLSVRRPELAARLLCGSPQAAVLMQDKRQSWLFSQAHGLPFIPTHTADTCVPELPADLDFPLLAKPLRGFASQGVYLLTRQAQLAALACRPEYVIQPWVGPRDRPGRFLAQLEELGLPLFYSFEAPKYAIQTLIVSASHWHPAFCTRHIMSGGASRSLSRAAEPELERIGEACAHAFAAAGWRGPLNIQCLQDHDGSFRIHEFSGRMTGATAARLHLGYDEIGLACELLLGRPLPAPPAPGARVERQLFCRPLPEAASRQLRQTGRWEKPSD